MTAMTAVVPWGRELTVDELDAMPDDGHRRELIDGTLIVTPAPVDASPGRLRSSPSSCASHAAQTGLAVLFAPFDVRTSREDQPPARPARRRNR